MAGNFIEKITFENDIYADDKVEIKTKPEKKADVPYASEFFTPELQEKVGKALLEQKVELYKQGIVDYKIQVVRQGKQITLTATPSNAPKKNAE